LEKSANEIAYLEKEKLRKKKEVVKKPKLWGKIKAPPSLEHDRDSVRRGKIFATSEEKNYADQLIKMFEQHKH